MIFTLSICVSWIYHGRYYIITSFFRQARTQRGVTAVSSRLSPSVMGAVLCPIGAHAHVRGLADRAHHIFQFEFVTVGIESLACCWLTYSMWYCTVQYHQDETTVTLPIII